MNYLIVSSTLRGLRWTRSDMVRISACIAMETLPSYHCVVAQGFQFMLTLLELHADVSREHAQTTIILSTCCKTLPHCCKISVVIRSELAIAVFPRAALPELGDARITRSGFSALSRSCGCGL